MSTYYPEDFDPSSPEDVAREVRIAAELALDNGLISTLGWDESADTAPKMLVGSYAKDGQLIEEWEITITAKPVPVTL